MTVTPLQVTGEPRGDEPGDAVRLGDLSPRVERAAAATGAGLLLASVALGVAEGDGLRRLSSSYLVAFLLVLSLGLGALFWVTLQHLVGARRSVAVRRLGELLASTMPALAVLSLPIVVPAMLGSAQLFPWLEGAGTEPQPGNAAGRPYLTRGFFGARWALYFGFWIAVGGWMLRRSVAQDGAGDLAPLRRVRELSPLVMIGIALTATFASVDYVMSLDPTWHSALFGVYFLSGCVTAAVAAMVLMVAFLHQHGRLLRTVTTPHLHDLGRTLFVCALSWAYLAFSQFLLIWYAAVPEETAHYAVRARGGWLGVAVGLILGHFLLPFLGLLTGRAKRHGRALSFWAGWLLTMHLVDLHFVVTPALDPNAVPWHPLDASCSLGLLALLAADVAHRARRCDLTPARAPRRSTEMAREIP